LVILVSFVVDLMAVGRERELSYHYPEHFPYRCHQGWALLPMQQVDVHLCAAQGSNLGCEPFQRYHPPLKGYSPKHGCRTRIA